MAENTDTRAAAAAPTAGDGPAGIGTTGPAGAPDDYDVRGLVGAGGGQGYVFRAVLRGDRLGLAGPGAGPAGREVALKQFGTGVLDGRLERRVEQLDEVVRGLRHPHLARQLEVFRGPAPRPPGQDGDGRAGPGAAPEADADLLYVASEWVPGRPLGEAAERAPLGRILDWVRQVGEALDYLHAAAVHDDGPLVHRDVKPANVVVTPGGEAVLIDLGLVKSTPPALADEPDGPDAPDEPGHGPWATGTPWGSPGFIPPETADPAAGGSASDRWQLAATLVAVLLGEGPGSRADAERLGSRLRARLAPEVADPGPVVDGILAMLVPDPGERPRSAADWAAGLGAAAGPPAAGGSADGAGSGSGSGGPPGAGRRQAVKVAVALGGALALAAAAFLAGLVTGDDGDGGDGGATPTGADRLTVTATIDNRVTSGERMREDTPAYLSTVTENFCRPNGCAVAGTDLGSGDQLTLVCQTVGQRTTNGDDTSTEDDTNPELYDSRLWYYAVLGDRQGFISEVWIAGDFRGGMDLPLC
jgi:hypothetical protein